MIKQNFSLFLATIMSFLFISACQKATPPEKQTEKKPVKTEAVKKEAPPPVVAKAAATGDKCSVFVPPWGDEYWEKWGDKNPEKFEIWYGKIIPQMKTVDLKLLSECKHLENVFIGFSELKDLSVFKDMKNLRKLDMRFAKNIKDLTPLKNAQNLEYLNIWKTQITDLTPITGLKKLKRIDAKMTAIKDISMLKTMTWLESIDLLQTKVEDISVFADLKNLKELLICSTPVTNIDVIYPIAEQITYLDICNVKLKDYNRIKEFKNLRMLKVWGLPIKDLNLFKEMRELEHLDIWNTKVKDLTPLFNMKELRKLIIVGLTIPAVQIEKLKETHPGIEIVTKLE